MPCQYLHAVVLQAAPAEARNCPPYCEEIVTVVVYSGTEVDVKVQLMFFVMSMSQVSPNEVWVVWVLS